MGETWGQGSRGWPAACSLDSPINHLRLRLRQRVWVEEHVEVTKMGSGHGKINKNVEETGNGKTFHNLVSETKRKKRIAQKQQEHMFSVRPCSKKKKKKTS